MTQQDSPKQGTRLPRVNFVKSALGPHDQGWTALDADNGHILGHFESKVAAQAAITELRKQRGEIK